MLLPLEREYHKAEIKELLDQATDLGADSLPIFDRIRRLLLVLEKDKRGQSLEWFRSQEKYALLAFIDTDALPFEVRASRDTTRAEAVDWAMQLQADGLSQFRIMFGAYGDYVEPTRDSPQSTAMDTMRTAYGLAWKIWRATNDAYTFVRKEPEESQFASDLAVSMADELKDRFSWAWIVVRVPIIGGGEAKEVR